VELSRLAGWSANRKPCFGVRGHGTAQAPAAIRAASVLMEKRRKRLFGWATVVAVLCAIGIGMLHGLGNKIFDAVWMFVVRGRG